MKDNVHPRVKERACDKAIKKTLTYSAVFKYPMSFNQLATFLISKQKFNYDTFVKSLYRLIKKRHIRMAKGKFYLNGIKPVSWEKRYKNSQTIIKKSLKAIKLLEIVPWLKMIAITGSVAANNAEENDDVDLFIITQSNRLWLTRGFTTIVLSIARKYAIGKNNKEKLCCNIFIDENHLRWPNEKSNLFVAHDILSMQPILNRDNTYFKFVKANKWALEYFGQYHIELPNLFEDNKKNGNRLGNYFDDLAMKAQLNYMKKKKTTEITKKGFLHFNKHDHTEIVLGSYKKLLETDLGRQQKKY